MTVEVRDVAPGLWIWRQPHPDWDGDEEWLPEVTSVAVQSEGVGILLDPLAPPPAAREVWDRIEALRPTVVAVLKPDHVRDVDLFVRWYGARAFGPFLFWPGDLPHTELQRLRPDDVLPGGLVALHDGREGMETPLYLPEQRALVFADGMTAPEGKLRIWKAPGHEQRVLPAFRKMLELPFERVIVSHGEPVHDRAAFEAALEAPPWGDRKTTAACSSRALPSQSSPVSMCPGPTASGSRTASSSLPQGRG
jgi:glyoxylase-like metal-dependent hydrolase (beta-lactamase superfamily II)